MLDLGDIKEEEDVLRADVHSLTEIHMLAIPLVVPSFFQLAPLHRPRCFDLFLKYDNMVSIDRTKRG